MEYIDSLDFKGKTWKLFTSNRFGCLAYGLWDKNAQTYLAQELNTNNPTYKKLFLWDKPPQELIEGTLLWINNPCGMTWSEFIEQLNITHHNS